MSSPAQSRTSPSQKLAIVALIVAFTTGLSGYCMGLLQTDRSVAKAPTSVPTPAPATVASDAPPEAPAYHGLRDRAHQPNHGWKNQLASLPPPPPVAALVLPLNAAERSVVALRRTTRRAYTGAPPVVPHPIAERSAVSCLACHGTPTQVGNTPVPQISHARFSQCIQCHAPASPVSGVPHALPSAESVPLDNSFSGLLAPASGTRAYPGAPPVMPHGTAMREDCRSCHGPGGSSLLRTSHPLRQNCLQCHATDAVRETLPPKR